MPDKPLTRNDDKEASTQDKGVLRIQKLHTGNKGSMVTEANLVTRTLKSIDGLGTFANYKQIVINKLQRMMID